MSASEPTPDPVQTRWTLTVGVNYKGSYNAARYTFWADAKTQDQALELAHANGFACVRKNPSGHIIPNGRFEVRVSTGEL